MASFSYNSFRFCTFNGSVNTLSGYQICGHETNIQRTVCVEYSSAKSYKTDKMDLKANYRVINIKDITSFPGSFQVKAVCKISVFIKEVCLLKNQK